jgi:hypothetical protein
VPKLLRLAEKLKKIPKTSKVTSFSKVFTEKRKVLHITHRAKKEVQIGCGK